MKKLYTLFYFLSPLLPITALYQANPGKYTDFTFLITMIFGACAYTWLIFQFVLSARPKFAETYFGMDKIYRMHGIMAVVSIIMVFIHQLFLEEIYGESLKTQLGSISMYVFIGVSGITLVLMVNSFITQIPPIRWVRKTIEQLKIIRYEHMKLIHNTTIIALVLMVIHVLMTSAAKSNGVVFGVFLCYPIIGGLFYIYHKFIKNWILKSNAYIVSDVVQESPNMWSIHFQPNKGKIFSYLPGQFGFYQIQSQGISHEEHPFSFSSSPTNNKNLTVTIKELGDYTSQIKNVKKGDKIAVDGPYGRFTYLHQPKEDTTVFVVGGVGITPALSMLRHMRDTTPNRKVILIWGMNTLSDYIHQNEFLQMQQIMKNFTLIPVVAKDTHWEGFKGYIDQEKLKTIFSKHALPVESTGYYLCGPPVLMDSTIQNLKQFGIPSHRVHFEKFSL